MNDWAWLTNMAVLFIEHEFARQIAYEEIIDEFASLNARIKQILKFEFYAAIITNKYKLYF